MTVGRLQRLNLREVWPHEAHDFTRWLQENISVLNEVLGLDLQEVEREQSTGSFNVDLLGTDSEGDRVVIENQLGPSDHDHLGKLITYLAAFGAQKAIWIVSDARPEHVRAVSWLNESPSADFFLVKLEAVRIGESDPAPLLTKIVGPSLESREIGEAKQKWAERHHQRFRFWEGLLAHARGRSTLHAAISPSKENSISTGAGISGLAFIYAIRKTSARVELYIDRGNVEENQRLFEALRARAHDIETRFGEPLTWEPLEGKRACRVKHEILGSGLTDEEQWDTLQGAMVDAMTRLHRALEPELRTLRKQLQAAAG